MFGDKSSRDMKLIQPLVEKAKAFSAERYEKYRKLAEN